MADRHDTTNVLDRGERNFQINNKISFLLLLFQNVAGKLERVFFCYDSGNDMYGYHSEIYRKKEQVKARTGKGWQVLWWGWTNEGHHQ